MYKSTLKIFSFLLLLLLVFAGCGKLDNLDTDDFNFFEEEQNSVAGLRRYNLPTDSDQPIVEYLVDDSYEPSVAYEKHIRKICDYAKFPYRATKITSFNSNTISPSVRVLCVMETMKLSQASIDRLVGFVAGGGTLFMPFATEDKRMAFLMGFKPDAEYETDVTSKGFLFNYNLLPNTQNLPYNVEAVHFGYDRKNFSKDVDILGTAVNNTNFPLVIENRIGQGKVFFYNTTLVFEKIERGLLFSGIMSGLQGVPYPIANVSTIFLDDFPSPLYNIKTEPIKSEMGLTITDFVKDVWWPDMILLAKKYNLKYSAMIAFDYKNKVDPPFIFDQWEENKMRSEKRVEPISDWLVRNVKKNGHELAFHGYNHVSLRKTLWPNQDFIPTSLQAVRKKWEISNFGALPATYVPPSNVIDKDGIRLLKKGMPSLQFMCSVYLGELEEGGAREFDFDPFHKDLFDYPRISDGFYLDNEKMLSQQSMYIYTGIWTHFVHPDDVYQIANAYTNSAGDFDLRNKKGLGWRKSKGKANQNGMFQEFDNYLKRMKQLFPHMRYVDAGVGGKVVNDWRASGFSHKQENGKYTVAELQPEKSLSESQYWFVYASDENSPRIQEEIQKTAKVFSKTRYMDGTLFMVLTQSPELTVGDLKFNTSEEKDLIASDAKKAIDVYKRYVANVKRFNAGGSIQEWVDDSDEKLKLEIQSLKTRMLASQKIDTAVWNQYAKYLSWEDRGAEVWKMLEQHNLKYPSRENVMYSKQLAKIVDYPNELTREKWLSAQMLVTPNDKDLLNSYVASFQTPENKDKIRTALTNLLKVDTSFETYLKYIEHLLAYDQAEALRELESKTPTVEYRTLATDVTWLYANAENYEKAYEWSAFSDEIDFASKMSWLVAMKDYKELERIYAQYIESNPDDLAAKVVMAEVFHETGRFKEAWLLSDSLPAGTQRTALQTMLNKDVIYVEASLQQDLLSNHSGFFLPEVRDSLNKSIRKDTGDFLALNSAAESNRDAPSAFKNVLSYNFYDKKTNLHSIGLTYSTMYDIDQLIKDADNVTHAIGGLQYQFNNPKSKEFKYWSRARIEYSDLNKFFYHFGIGANYAKNKAYKSAEFKIFPAETGPSHSKDIYRMQLNIYQDYYFFKLINASLSLEGNYYTASKTDSQFKTDDSFEGSATVKVTYDDGQERKMMFLPFVEGSLSQGSLGNSFLPLSTGYPYWMIDERVYGGGGLGWKYGLEESNFSTRVEAGWFFDDYSDEFQRYTGKVAFQLFDFTAVTAAFEIYAQSKFYSNNLQFGIKHNLKTRNKRKAAQKGGSTN